jgi:ribulose 1,5-bisphosphate synthetase/thiazole synthase
MTSPHYFLSEWIEPTTENLETDLCIYGGTSAGIIAAVTAKARGLRVLILHPGKFLGGMTSGGLGWTDFGKKHVIGGRSRQFYRALGVDPERMLVMGERSGPHGHTEEDWDFEVGALAEVWGRRVPGRG